MSPHPFRNRAIAGGAIGLALAVFVAGPASAAPPAPPSPAPYTAPVAAPAASSAAVHTFETQLSSTASAAPDVSATAAAPTAAVSAAAVGSMRRTYTRGGPLAWSSDTFQWFWSGSSMTSSSGWQADGYIFPNVITDDGIQRTYASAAKHLWRASASIGAGINTPWGVVDVYSDTITDYFTLTPGGSTGS